MINVIPGLTVPESELQFTFTTSQGPGGQNVNKVATKAILQFDVAASPVLTDDQRRQIRNALSSRINKQGILQVTCSYSRSREANRRRAIEQFTTLLRAAIRPRKKRTKTRPTKASVERRLAVKAARSHRKRDRRSCMDRD